MGDRFPDDVIVEVFRPLAEAYARSTRVTSNLAEVECFETLRSARLCSRQFGRVLKKLLYETYNGRESLHYTCTFIEGLLESTDLRDHLHHIHAAQGPEDIWVIDTERKLARMRDIEARVRSVISPELRLALPRASLWGRSAEVSQSPLWILILLAKNIETLQCKFEDLLPVWSFVRSSEQMFASGQILANLKSLYISNIGTMLSRIHSVKLLTMLLGRPTLKVVEMQRLEVMTARKFFVETISQPIHIHELSIHGEKITGEILIAILTKFPSLELLRFDVLCWQTDGMGPVNRNTFGNILRIHGQSLPSLSIGEAWDLRTLAEPMGDISRMENLRYLKFNDVSALLGSLFESRLAEILPKSLRCLEMQCYNRRIWMDRVELLRSQEEELMEDDDFNELEAVHFQGEAFGESGDIEDIDLHFSRIPGHRSFILTSHGSQICVYGT